MSTTPQTEKTDLGQFSQDNPVMSALELASILKKGVFDPRELAADAGDRSPETLHAITQGLKAKIEAGEIDPQRFPSIPAKLPRRRYASQVMTRGEQTYIGHCPEGEFIPPRAVNLAPGVIRGKTQRLRDHLAEAIRLHLEAPFTVRNCYYALVSLFGDHYPKNDATYRKVKAQLVTLRRQGVIKHDDIIDPSRRLVKYRTDESVQRLLDMAGQSYNPSIWADRSILIQVWTEKDTVSGLLNPVIDRYQVPLFVARGFGSESFMHLAASMIRKAAKTTIVLYVGDHDPSGCYMPATLIGGLKRLLGDQASLLYYSRIAVLPSQALGPLARFGHAPNRNDTRHEQFIKIFGSDAEAVELDAMRPQDVRQLVEREISQYLPAGWESQYSEREREGRQQIERVALDAWGAEQMREHGVLEFIDSMKGYHEDELIELMREQAEEFNDDGEIDALEDDDIQYE